MMKRRVLLESSELRSSDSRVPLLIAGPCSAESEEQVLQTARGVAPFAQYFRAGVWKPRTQPGSFEGLGEIAFPWLKRAEQETGLVPLIEVANPRQVERALSAGFSHFWIGARTTVNPFYVQEISEALRGASALVLVKNPINPDLALWVGAFERLAQVGLTRLGAIHRGFSSFERGIYRNPPHWEIPIELKRLLPELPMICDPSHLAGKREILSQIAQTALDLDYDGLMFEVHPEPARAWSDPDQQITPNELAALLSALHPRARAQDDLLVGLRRRIDSIDHQILDLLSQRMKVVQEIGVEKKRQNTTVLQMQRWEQVLEDRLALAQRLGLSQEFIQECFEAIHTESLKKQSEC